MNLPPLDRKSTKQIFDDIMHDPITSIGDNLRKYGDIYRQNVFRTSHYIITNPLHVKHILDTNANNYRKPDKKLAITYFGVKQEMGENIMTTNDGAFWSKSRQAATPSFMNTNFPEYAKAIIKNTINLKNNYLQAAKERRDIDFFIDMYNLTCTNLFSTMIKSPNVDPAEISTYAREWMDQLAKRFSTTNFLPFLLPTQTRREYYRVKNKYNNALDQIISERLSSQDKPNDLLDLMINAFKNEKDQKKFLKIIQNQLHILVIGGHDTTADTLAWTFAYLSMYPEICNKVRAEIKKVLNGKEITYNDISSLSYTTNVIKESLRLRGSVFYTFREAINDDTVGEYFVPKGTIILLPIYFINRHPEYWDNPEGFNPERFTNKPFGQNERYAYIPFSAGNRSCIGSGFAMLEMVIALAVFLAEIEFTLLPGYLGIPLTGILVAPKGGMKMKVKSLDKVDL